MRETVNTVVRWSALCALMLFASSPAIAEPPRPAGENRWVPSLGIYSGVTIQQWKAGFASACEEGGPGDLAVGHLSCNFWDDPGTPGPLRPMDQESRDLAVSPFIGFNLQLMTPAITAIPGRPRLYLVGENQLTFGTTRDVASEGEPAGVAIPSTVQSLTQASALSLIGVGSKTSGTYETLGWGAGIGVAFPFKIGRRQLWIKPNAAWTRYKVAIDAKVVAGIKDDFTTANQPQRPPWGENLREVNLLAKTEQYYNGIGPGLEIEMDALQVGPIGVSIYVNGNAYKILGNRETELSQTLSFDDSDGIPADNYHAQWRFKVDPWLYRVAGGVRFAWVGD